MVAVETKKSQVSCNEGNVKRFIDRVKNQLAKILQVIISFIFYPFYLPYPHQPWLTLYGQRNENRLFMASNA